MTGRDDFEHRLGQGLKRWAQAGEPTMDLEGYVRERSGQRLDGPGVLRDQHPERAAASAPVRPAQAGRRARRWRAWLAGAAAAAVITLAAGITFPGWAGAAAGLPLVGPVITRIIMEDAGLKWALDMGLIQGNVAEVTRNGVTVRILGVVADSRRTTVLYQVLGAPPAARDDRPPVPASSRVTPPERPGMPVEASIVQVNGQGAASASSPPEETPLGYVGTVSTLPLETKQAEMELRFMVAGEEVTLTVTASREETDRFSREVTVGRTLEHDGVRITVESVIYTPAETVVRIREEGGRFSAPVQWDGESQYDYLEADGRRYRPTGGSMLSVDNVSYMAFPPVKGQARLVLKPAVKGVPIEAVWPLEEGAVAEVMGVPVALVEVELTAGTIGFRWHSPAKEDFLGVAGFEVIDAAGNVHPLGDSWASLSNHVFNGVRNQHYAAPLPEGVEPAAVRATQAGVLVKGPWVFELPR